MGPLTAQRISVQPTCDHMTSQHVPLYGYEGLFLPPKVWTSCLLISVNLPRVIMYSSSSGWTCSQTVPVLPQELDFTFFLSVVISLHILLLSPLFMIEAGIIHKKSFFF